MSSEELGLNSQQLVFHQDDTLRFGAPPQRRVGDSGPKTRELSGFIDDRFFPPQGADFRRSLYGENLERRDPPEPRNWNPNVAAVRTPSGEGSDDDEDDEEDDVEEDDDDGDVGGLFGEENRSKGSGGNNGSNGEDKMGNGNAKHQQFHSSFGGALLLGSSREVLEKNHSVSVGQQTLNNNSRDSPGNNHQLPGRLGSYQNAVTVAESSDGDMYYSQYLQGSEGSAATQKDSVVENGCGFSGRKDALCSSESGDSLRAILSDPVTGALMDDAMILPCGHSFGGGGVQQVIRMKACFSCSQSISEDSIAPNLSLRSAVQAFRREEELHFYRSSKRKRERSDQGGYGDLALTDPPRGRGVQFPFAVTDRVIIKGNKRTPQRFVGREAVVTTQCLNGWYVVKTLDNAESVKLQYRSLAKVSDDSPSKALPSKMAPNWL
ncbi:U-box domain-containing protein 62-like isoform X2 [Argentina anserina]|uniref:U-box domain-containing protein 62-like isoform X2 n=1 Tax=Argentina anserina TaxID=57926 RepID=UPI00217680FD|nr:U-box domain-containing protein 62-like isoform X2 [Potentilla anserina]